MDDAQVKPARFAQRLDLFPEGHALPFPVGVDQGERAPVRAVGQGAQDAHDGCDADAARDKDEAGRVIMPVGGEGAVGPIQVDALAGTHLPDLSREVAQFPDGEAQPFRLFRAGGEGERMLSVGEGGAAQRQPGELAGVERQPAVPLRPEHQRPGVPALRLDRLHHIRPAQLQPRLDHAHIGQQPYPKDAVGDPKRLFPWCADVVSHQHDVSHRQRHDRGRQEAVPDPPLVVVNSKPPAPERDRHQRNQRQHGCDPEAGTPRRGKEVQQAEPSRVLDEQDQGVGQHDSKRHQRDLPVEEVNDVAAVGRLEPAEARGQHELEAQHRQPGKAQRHREFAPEPPPRRRRPDQEQEQRRQRQQEVEGDPEDAL